MAAVRLASAVRLAAVAAIAGVRLTTAYAPPPGPTVTISAPP
ncbi:hypothetical protein [Streptomyces chrestomyceticus]|nr:hypothetical protein [Streptomyces chrestomyceticus]